MRAHSEKAHKKPQTAPLVVCLILPFSEVCVKRGSFLLMAIAENVYMCIYYKAGVVFVCSAFLMGF